MKPGQNSYDSEYAVIGGLFRDPSKFQELDLLREDFADESLGEIYAAISNIISQNKPIDPIMVAEYLFENTGKGWIELIRKTIENTPSAANLIAYARIVKNISTKRAAETIAIKLQDNIWQNDDIVDEVMGELLQLNRGRKSYECSIQDAVQAALEYIDGIHQNSGKLVGVTSGLTKLDEMLGGYHETDLIAIGGRPAMGKTAFMLNCCERCGVPIGIITGEQGRNQIAQRMITINGKINSYRMRLGKLTEMDWQNVVESSMRLQKMRAWLFDRPMPRVTDIARQARRWKYHHDIKGLWVDYIQRVSGDPKKRRHEQIEEIAQTLKSIAVELDIPVMTLAQINRDVEKRNDKRPFMSDFKDSGAIEQESDIMLTLYRDEVYHPQTHDTGLAEISVQKNRHGPIGKIKTRWVGQYMTFDELGDDDE